VELVTARASVGLAVPYSRIPVRGLVLVGSVALAYNYSLETLTRGLSLQTPVAYLALVPLIALLLGAVNFRLQPNLRAIHDRQLDWIVGLFLVAVAAVINLLLPSAYSADFWLHRIDMLGLPFFSAGMIALLYGTRRLWALRWAVLFLFLAWPDPYVTVLAAVIGTSTDLALAAVGASLNVIPVAQPLGNGTFLVTHGANQFSLAVGSACSGINSLVGFVIIGAAFNTIFTGGIIRRILWLAAGLLLVGALNVARIDLIFIAGWALGESFAVDVLHPVAGIIVFGIGALAMLGLAPFFGLRIPAPARRDNIAMALPKPAGDSLSGRPVSRHLRLAAPMAVGLMIAALLAMPDASFAHYDSLVDAFGHPTLGAIDPNSVTVSGWQAAPSTSFDQATTYFGPHATWERVPFSSTAAAASGPSSVYLDVIRTDDSGSLASYGVEACYNFHGFSQVLNSATDVGAGVEAKVASYRSPVAGTDWSILWWEWPYSAGGQTRYERLVLLAPLDAAGQPGHATTQASFNAAEATIESMARSIVAAGMNDPAPTPAPGSQL
jgi:exosortase/archaeosortase family protein